MFSWTLEINWYFFPSFVQRRETLQLLNKSLQMLSLMVKGFADDSLAYVSSVAQSESLSNMLENGPIDVVMMHFGTRNRG